MTRVLLYCRVSTDEQADGCSLDVQERFLRAHCANRGYEIIGEPYKDDYSAKGYQLKRPELKRLFEYCRKNPDKVDKVLFLRWDRFTRNAEFGLTYKRKFIDEMGIEINAIENPINFDTPEWSTLLPLYCGVAQTENEKNSRRTKDGIHGTLLKGKCAGRAPIGYKNIRVSKHDCWVEVDNTVADTIKTLFKEVAKGEELPTMIKNRIYPKMSDTTFFRAMKNRFYTGYVHVPAYGDDPEQYIKGQHEAIIDQQTFDAVQSILNGNRKQQPKVTNTVKPELYLRKILVCPVCGNILTGAFSKGNGGKYPYYFCNREHKHLNVRADKANDGFVDYLSVLKPHKAIVELYKEIMDGMRGERPRENQKKVVKLEMDIQAAKERIIKVKDLFIDGSLTRAEKDEAIDRYNGQIESMNSQITSLRCGEDSQLKDKLAYAISLIENLAEMFTEASPEAKIKIIGSIFPEKIEYDGEKYRTSSYNQVLDIIFKNTKQLQGYKNENNSKSRSHFQKGCNVGLEPTTTGTTIQDSTN